jgi:hypothetical protein
MARRARGVVVVVVVDESSEQARRLVRTASCSYEGARYRALSAEPSGWVPVGRWKPASLAGVFRREVAFAQNIEYR